MRAKRARGIFEFWIEIVTLVLDKYVKGLLEWYVSRQSLATVATLKISAWKFRFAQIAMNCKNFAPLLRKKSMKFSAAKFNEITWGK